MSAAQCAPHLFHILAFTPEALTRLAEWIGVQSVYALQGFVLLLYISWGKNEANVCVCMQQKAQEIHHVCLCELVLGLAASFYARCTRCPKSLPLGSDLPTLLSSLQPLEGCRNAHLSPTAALLYFHKICVFCVGQEVTNRRLSKLYQKWARMQFARANPPYFTSMPLQQHTIATL